VFSAGKSRTNQQRTEADDLTPRDDAATVIPLLAAVFARQQRSTCK
jgi:hypothetical protein